MANTRTGFRALRIAAIVALVFGLATILSGGRALFGDAAARAAVGEAVPFVLWFNFLAGFAYVAAAVGLYLGRGFAVALSLAIVVATVLVAGAFGLHVAQGGAFEGRTVGALILRIGVWAVIAVVAWRRIGRVSAT